MKSTVLGALLILLLTMSGCRSSDDNSRYLIKKDQIGHLSKSSQVKELDSIFTKDSVANEKASQRFSNEEEIKIYSNDGKELLRLQPVDNFKKTSTIADVEILDSIYKTGTGLNRASDFQTLQKDYEISRIENMVGSVIVFVDELNAYFTIDKKNINEPTGMDDKIKASQIHDDAPIGHFWISWH